MQCRLAPHVLGAVAAVLLATLVFVVSHRGPAGAAPAATPAGDVNADGAVDVSDAVFLLRFLFAAGPAPAPCDGAPPDAGAAYFPQRLGAATVVLVRHAEKETAGADPGLTPAGRERAERLARLLEAAPVSHLIASDLRRTAETLAPLADASGLVAEPIAAAGDVVARLEALPAGSFAVVAHHSFTVHEILEGLGLADVRGYDVSGDSYDHLFLVIRNGEDPAQLVHLRY